MTTPTPTQPATTTSGPALRAAASADEMLDILERRAKLENPPGVRRAGSLEHQGAPPATGPRDLSGLDEAIGRAYANFGIYFSQPGWNALTQIHRQATETLRDLNGQAERTPQAAIQAARITTLAASLIARHAAQVSSYLANRNLQDSPAAEAVHALVRAAETHAAQAAGLEDGQALDTPRLLIAHIHKLNKELQRAEPAQASTQDVDLDTPDDPALDSALSLGATADPELAEASRLMTALSELAAQARRAAHRLTLDVRLHGMVEAAQLRGFEIISASARAVMRRYDNQGRSGEGRRTIASMIVHYAEQRLERMRGTLGADEQRELGHYESDPPDRYIGALYEESHAVVMELRAKHLLPEVRTDLQIRFLLAQRDLHAAIHGDQEWGTRPFPFYLPAEYVAGMETNTPEETRLALIAALRRRVENNPYHRDAAFLNAVKDRFTQELTGPPHLTADARNADITADQGPHQAQTTTTVAASPTASAERAPAAAPPELPRRDRTRERRHPGNLGVPRNSTAEAPPAQNLTQLLEGEQDRIKEVSETLIAGRNGRAEEYPAPAETTPSKATTRDEAQHLTQPQLAERTASVTVR
ncbi:hypothetical protein AB0K02_24175 [Streptomyces sp. NPDC049597]|uniref:hypothetical protein n=1 Tax=Streptomyces sp. NPDC049597 TaxID=3155276 RepID=UPI00344628FA